MGRSIEETTRVIRLALERADESAERGLVNLLYDELHELAERELRRERRDHTLQPTALVHEAYLRLTSELSLAGADRSRFLALAATTMRRVLVDHARRRQAQKRGAGVERITLTPELGIYSAPNLDLLALNEALEELERLDPRQARIVELRFFVGLEETEIAGLLGVSRTTVQGDWAMARAWIRRELSRGEVQPGA